jgi:hypothetical protein
MNCDAGFGAVQLVARFTYLDLVGGNPVLISLTPAPRLAGKRTSRSASTGISIRKCGSWST